jgi:hypothetical protein
VVPLGRIIIVLLALLSPMALQAATQVDTLNHEDKVWDNSMHNLSKCGEESPCGGTACNYANLGGNTRIWIGTNGSVFNVSTYVGIDITDFIGITIDSAFIEGYMDSEDSTLIDLKIAVNTMKNVVETNWDAYGDSIETRDGACAGCEDVGNAFSCGDSSMSNKKRIGTDTAATTGTSWNRDGGVGTDVDYNSAVVDLDTIAGGGTGQWHRIKITNCLQAAIDSEWVDPHNTAIYVADLIVRDQGHKLKVPFGVDNGASYGRKQFYSRESGTNPLRVLIFQTVEDEEPAAIDYIQSPPGAGTIQSKDPSLIHRP